MSLTNCPDCGQQISTEAAACMSCGRPSPQAAARTALQDQMLRFKGKGCAGCFILLGIFLLIVACLFLLPLLLRA